jgi:hypothetical protein
MENTVPVKLINADRKLKKYDDSEVNLTLGMFLLVLKYLFVKVGFVILIVSFLFLVIKLSN